MSQAQLNSRDVMITNYYCSLCGDDFSSPRKSVIVRHVLEQHSGYGFKCQGCSKLHGRMNQEHTGCRYPNGDHATLVERLTGKSGNDTEMGYEEFRKTLNSKILEKLAPRPGPKRARSLSVSSKKSWKKARRSHSVVAAAPAPAVVTSPVAKVAPPPPPTFSTASSCRKAPVESTTSTVVTTRDDVSIAGSWATSVNGKEEGELESAISKKSEGEEQLSLTVDPCETLDTETTEMPPPPTTTTVSAFHRLNPPLALVSSRPVCSPAVQVVSNRSEQQLRTDVKLASWSDCQRGRVVLDVGGTRFTTSTATLTADPGSLLCSMVEPGSLMRPWRVDEHNSPVYFLDRDPAHFRHLLNYLRLGNSWSAHSLPRELRYLYDIRAEAEHFGISGLQEKIERRIAIMSEATFEPSA